MPFINGCYFTKSSISRDNDFLKAQGLTETQISAISAYFLQRLSAHAYNVMGQSTLIAGIVFCVVIFMLRH